MISLRLKKICDLVDNNSVVADIGTDHGIIPVYLSKEKVSKKIIATDISKNSLEKLNKKLLFDKTLNNIETRVSDGLDSFKEFEIDTIIISGMGGVLIRDILLSNLNIAKSANYLILSPNNSLDILRKFLLENSFTIENESDVFENNKYYQILKVKVGKELYKYDYEYIYGKLLIKNKSENLKLFLKNELKKYNLILDKIDKNTSEQSYLKIEDKICVIRSILNEF
ncbi:MAG: class I SAM-dependent methyltransferase [Peptoniphilaceae bacterium]|uniref:tRNA (adenine(22)-N(1))-methyltransferase n=1 Tax=Parvimonas sp. TaxID=1944660 RepID=UPI0025D2AF69|nr:class I SAM-dependent methyltransferase [Parvimonas sp.]MCI5997516.1 class I SAM-dependent methyltransferase [Parvimonas sp.]MDD7764625.1 class I SAM-dependent methyltransferase [Peptoniphilaceae bacterium]MDY3050601.1 class I SAM-dependent methyltransferase [Parvimonas sp.]